MKIKMWCLLVLAIAGVCQADILTFCKEAESLDYADNYLLGPSSSYAGIGYTLSSAGDVDGDGTTDFLTRCYQTLSKAVYVYSGSNLAAPTVPAAGEYLLAITNTRHICHAISAGDVDGDDREDILLATTASAGHDYGRVYLFYHASLAALGSEIDAQSADITFTQTEDNWISGDMAIGSADIDGDGRKDILIGEASWYSNNPWGRVFIFLATSLDGADGELNVAEADYTITGAYYYFHFGNMVKGVGDVDGDGLEDIIVNRGGSASHIAYLFLGKDLTPDSPDLESSDAAQVFVGVYSEESQFSAQQCITAADVDADGLSDLIMGYPYQGAAIFLGKNLPATPSSLSVSTDADFQLLADGLLAGSMAEYCPWDAYPGITVAAAGDVDDDGYEDVLISAPYYDNGYDVGAGIVWLVLGSSLHPDDPTVHLQNADFIFTGSDANHRAGSALLGPGDLDHDGLDDILVGAYGAGGTTCGSIYYIKGADLGYGLNLVENPAANDGLANWSCVGTPGVYCESLGNPWFELAASGDQLFQIIEIPCGAGTYTASASVNNKFADRGGNPYLTTCLLTATGAEISGSRQSSAVSTATTSSKLGLSGTLTSAAYADARQLVIYLSRSPDRKPAISRLPLTNRAWFDNINVRFER